jgi:tetratricopeptide (TPR) repeat protein
MTVLSRSSDATHSDLAGHSIPYPAGKYWLLETWPKFTGRCPTSVPANVESFYNQGLENLAAGRWDAAGAMFRKSLDVATKVIAPDKRAKTLFARINELVAEGRLTNAMGEWSHELRLDGNDAVHDEEPETEADAHVMHRFAEALLTYSFTLPAMVEANRAKRTPVANDAAA